MKQLRKSFLAGLVALISIIVLHQPWLSLQNAIIGNRVSTIYQMAFLKVAVGFVTSLAVLGICKVLLRKLSPGSIAAAVFIQIVWIEFEWNFAIRAADTGELMVRFAEELGTLLAGGLLIGFVACARRYSRNQQPVRPSR
jgi:hypothetical protein